MEEILAMLDMAVNGIDFAITGLRKTKVDPEEGDKLTSIREELNRVLMDLEDKHLT